MTFGTGGGFTSIQVLANTFNPGSNQTVYTVPLNTVAYVKLIAIGAPGAGTACNFSLYDYTGSSWQALTGFASITTPGAPGHYAVKDTDISLGSLSTYQRLFSDTTMILYPNDRIVVSVFANQATPFFSILEQSVS